MLHSNYSDTHDIYPDEKNPLYCSY